MSEIPQSVSLPKAQRRELSKILEQLEKNRIGFTLSRSDSAWIPAKLFCGESEVFTRNEQLVIIYDKDHANVVDSNNNKPPLILGVIRTLKRYEEFLRERYRSSITDYPPALDEYQKLSFTDIGIVPLAELLVTTEGDKDYLVGLNMTVTYTPFPGSHVYLITDDAGKLLHNILRYLIKIPRPLIVGAHKYTHTFDIPLNHNFLPYHIGIFGATGTGKSCLAIALSQEIVRNTDFAVIIFDHSGKDYVPFYKEISERLNKKVVVDASEIEIGINEICAVIASMMRVKEEWLDIPVYKTKKSLKKPYSQYTDDKVCDIFEDAIQQLDAFGIRKSTINKLFVRFDYYIRSTTKKSIFAGLFKREKPPKTIVDMARELKKDNLPVVMDLSLESEIEIKQGIVGSVIDAIWDEIAQIIPENREYKSNIVLVIDEVQNYAPVMVYPVSRRPIEKIAREGRKWNLGLIAISQRLKGSLSTDVRANLNTLFFSKLTQEGDIEEVRQTAYMGWISTDVLSQLETREFFVSGLLNPLQKALAIRVRDINKLKEEILSFCCLQDPSRKGGDTQGEVEGV